MNSRADLILRGEEWVRSDSYRRDLEGSIRRGIASYADRKKDKDTRIVGDKVINLLISNEHANLTIPLFVPNRSLPHAAFADTLGGAFYTQIDIVVIFQ